MPGIKVEAFLSVPPCSGGILLCRLLEDVKKEFGDKIDIQVHRGPVPGIDELKISALPALVIGDLVRIMGLCPSRESLVAAFRECGLE